MSHLILPPSDDASREIQIPLLTQINKKIEEYADDDEKRDKLKLFVYEILTLMDGFYLDFPANFAIVSIDENDKETFISGDLHKLFYWMFMCRDKTS